MADDQGQARTEEPTPRRREEARKRGQVAVSSELTAALVVLAAAVFLLAMGPELGTRLLDMFRSDLTRVSGTDLDVAAAQALGMRVLERFALILGFLFGVLVFVAVGANVAQVGFRILPDRLSPDFERISPAAGWRRLWSVQSAWRVLLALLKIAVLVTVSVLVIRSRSGMLESLGHGTLNDAVRSGWGLCLRVFAFLAGALVLMGAVDYVVQWRRMESALRMTRQELKEEIKREEGDPLIKNRIRQLQRERAKQKMLVNVPRATVVVTNPTHLAIAIRYDRNTDKAPMVLAKGAGVMAKQIADLARRHSIPVLERPVVARAIYAGVKEGQEIPPELFRVVAEIIAFVFRLRGTAA